MSTCPHCKRPMSPLAAPGHTFESWEAAREMLIQLRQANIEVDRLREALSASRSYLAAEVSEYKRVINAPPRLRRALELIDQAIEEKP